MLYLLKQQLRSEVQEATESKRSDCDSKEEQGWLCVL